MIRSKLTIFALVAVTGLATAGAAAAQNVSLSIPEIEWDTTLVKYQFDSDKFVGQRFTAKCMPGSPAVTYSGVYGTDAYPSDNSICIAAVHAGQIDKEGGVVTVQLNPGEATYTGSSRNGIETASLPGTPRSFSFVDPSAAPLAADATTPVHLSHIPRIKWDTKFTSTGFAHKQLVGQRFTFNCPAAPNGLKPRRVVGTDSYAFNSMICVAAVHAGKITMAGGLVAVQMDPGMPKLVGSIRNGIETKNGSGGHTTISFVDVPVAAQQ